MGRKEVIEELRHLFGMHGVVHSEREALRSAIDLLAADGWQSMESAPKTGKSVLLAFRGGIISSGRYRAGNLGEPQISQIAWRCDCGGRFSTPIGWRPLPPEPDHD